MPKAYNLIKCAGSESWMCCRLNRLSTSSHVTPLANWRLELLSIHSAQLWWRHSKSKTKNLHRKLSFHRVRVKQWRWNRARKMERAFTSPAFAYWMRRFDTIDLLLHSENDCCVLRGPLALLTRRYYAIPCVLLILLCSFPHTRCRYRPQS